ncbi:Outer membrane receptor proteins, mostly Fe transport [Xylanibacter ruminicola]|uniref:Outer membrane receptor proteins, mostly Fe transport n=1 Tax=Xylanibacter ruminicola TaxID=839 RepID=A0A1H3YFZ0_XYLRU|nr:outer membrane beta-barrel family protein [Xylanibacter ruminicola]SEA10467.1 Outer membrane receptor proteins, mostly Fe transport [Xylanibacter ruminicola]
MKRLSFILLLCAFVSVASAQKVTYNFQDVTLSDALRYIQAQTTNYEITFIYDELEDFRITTHIQNKSIPDAIVQIVGFYPVRVVKSGAHEIYLECTHKTDRHLKGTIIDEQGHPVAYANIAILNPADSTLLSGGVSNEAGQFVVPYEQHKVLARISFIGYKTIYRLCTQEDMGTIQLHRDSYVVKGVEVKGSKRLAYASDRGLIANVKGTPLEQFGSVTEMLTHLPLMMSNGEIAGHGKPEIYINNKKVRNEQELDRYRSDEILTAEIVTNPGPEYGADVTSVIKLKTVRKTGEGWSGNFSAAYRQGKEYYANGNAALNYRTRNGMDFFARGYLTDNNQLITYTANDQLQASSTWDYKKSAERLVRVKYYFADLGWNWEINEHHSLGLTYTANNYIGDFKTLRTSDDQVWQDGKLVDGGHSVTTTLEKPRMTHAVNAYYVGVVGKWKIDFSADYYDAHNLSEMDGGTYNSPRSDIQPNVSSRTNNANQLLAEKLVITAPVPKGDLTFGEEASAVDRTSDFTQSGFSTDNNVHQETTVWSLFANYRLQLGKFSLNAGLRWQNEHNRYDQNGQRNDEMSPDYHAIIPRASLTYKTDKWTHTLAYNCTRNNPPYSRLTTAVNYRSRYEYDTGNPYLQPQISHTISWSSQWKWLYAELYYGYRKNVITSFQSAYDDVNHPGVIIDDYRNIPWWYSYGIDLNCSPKIGIWQMNYTVSLGLSDWDVKGMGMPYKWNGLCADFTLDNTFTLPHAWLLNIKGSVAPYQESGSSQRKATGSLGFRISKQFLKDKSLSIALLANDILHTQYTEMTAYGGINIRTQFKQYNDSRRVGINLSWKFNATRSRYKGSHAGQSERNRL